MRAPYRSTTSSYAARRSNACRSTAGAARARSRRRYDDVAALGRCHRPAGPERPAHAEHAPGSDAQSALVTAPTLRTVSTSGVGRSRQPLTEIGTSPTPKT